MLISDQVNIWPEITADRAGLAGPDTARGTHELLRRWHELDAGTREHMRGSARHCFERRYEIGAVARSLLAALQPASST